MTAATTFYIIRDYNTTAVLLGGIDADLVAASFEQVGADGAVLAEQDGHGVWQYVPESRRTADSRVVYVEATP